MLSKDEDVKNRFLVIGCGSIGQRHIRNLLSLLGAKTIMAFDCQESKSRYVHEKYGVEVVRSLEDAWDWHPDVCVICVPTSAHISVALEAAKRGCHLFIEKPLSMTEEGLDELVEITQRNRLVTMVGCNIRFHHGPTIIKRLLDDEAVGKIISVALDAGYYLPDWHPDQDYRQSYSANRSMGGGVVFDGSHEIDCARWLFGEITEIFCYGGKLSRLDIDVEDSADMLIKFEAGFSGMIHLDYLQRAYSRTCKVIGEEGTIIWDITKQLRWFSAKTKRWDIIYPSENYEMNEMYLEELRHYLNCVERNQKTVFDIEEAAHVTRLALAAKQSMITGEKVVIPMSPVKSSA